ncbi:rho-related GTP-binding protein RhoN isoform X2 [Lates japonicus]|uniref:Rho-related GTP-binding protein RhoN isoform X2 n=1 Tax=Lates japonicus TaxID=270547 RepID=A0AAD3NNY9_LATJO|nr:rho-related GTP-binding protein RhoN isoform X2 [Lates japonicus]
MCENQSIPPPNKQPENLILLPRPTVFENFYGQFEIKHAEVGRAQSVDTSGSPYYDNVRPLSYPDSDAVLICFDISRPETLDSVLKKGSSMANRSRAPHIGVQAAQQLENSAIIFQRYTGLHQNKQKRCCSGAPPPRGIHMPAGVRPGGCGLRLGRTKPKLPALIRPIILSLGK